MKLRRFGRRLLITLGVILVVNFIGGMVLDRELFDTNMANGPTPSIVRRPPATDYRERKMTSLPSYDSSQPRNSRQVDLRSRDLSAVDVTKKQEDLIYADFDSKTKWPAAVETMAFFCPEAYMKHGKNPGLGLRALHDKGITGKGVSIAIIDYPLLVDHAEVKGRVKMYEEIHCGDDDAAMHGCATSSIAVGKNVGVAPEADLYFIGMGNMRLSPLTLALRFVPAVGIGAGIDYGPIARGIDRIVEINDHLPNGSRIRVISISVGLIPRARGVSACERAIRRAEKEGIFVVTCSLDKTSGGKMDYMGLGREPLTDPDAPESYGPALFWAEYFFREGAGGRRPTLYVPMDSRCTASPTGDNDYVFYRSGGLSWTAPYIAGLYALACQVKPNVTPEEFWKAAMDTGDTVQVKHNGKTYPLEKIANPAKLIARLQKT
jgi:hypothetical protein